MLVFSIGLLPAQQKDFDMAIKATKQTIDELSYAGFSTDFNVDVDKLQKRWWKYSRRLGIVENMKTHYLVRIPSAEKGLSPVVLIEKASGDEKKSTLFLAVLDQTDNSYKSEVKQLLLAFKIGYYVEQVEEQIEKKELELSKVSNAFLSLVSQAQKNDQSPDERRSRQTLAQITKLSYELEALKRSLNDIR